MSSCPYHDYHHHHHHHQHLHHYFLSLQSPSGTVALCLFSAHSPDWTNLHDHHAPGPWTKGNLFPTKSQRCLLCVCVDDKWHRVWCAISICLHCASPSFPAFRPKNAVCQLNRRSRFKRPTNRFHFLLMWIFDLAPVPLRFLSIIFSYPHPKVLISFDFHFKSIFIQIFGGSSSVPFFSSSSYSLHLPSLTREELFKTTCFCWCVPSIIDIRTFPIAHGWSRLVNSYARLIQSD